jgi:hypothetical protein
MECNACHHQTGVSQHVILTVQASSTFECHHLTIRIRSSWLWASPSADVQADLCNDVGTLCFRLWDF